MTLSDENSLMHNIYLKELKKYILFSVPHEFTPRIKVSSFKKRIYSYVYTIIIDLELHIKGKYFAKLQSFKHQTRSGLCCIDLCRL